MLAKVGGLDIAGMTGVFLGGAAHRIPVVMDGFISAAAALAAVRLCHACVDYILPSHVSIEVGHQVVLEELGLVPLFDLQMRLGEGTGAALSMSIIEASARILSEMATFESAGVAGDPQRGRRRADAVVSAGTTDSDRRPRLTMTERRRDTVGADAARRGPGRTSAALPPALPARIRAPVAGGRPTGGAAGTTGRRLTLAVTFLTGIPLKVEGEVGPGDLWGSMGWYPLVGLTMGLAAWAVYAGLVSFLPGLVAATLVVILLELLTRGLHLDGLMDTADGILSGAPRERALELMKDHNVGAMGVAAAVLLLVLKVAALGALARADAAAPLLAGWCAARRCRRSTCTGGRTRARPAPARRSRASTRRDRCSWPAACWWPAWSWPAWPACGRRRRLLVRRPRHGRRLHGRGAGRTGHRGEDVSAASPATSTAWASSSPRRPPSSSGARSSASRHDPHSNHREPA